MKWAGDYVLTVNAGSSSIKLDLLKVGAENQDDRHHQNATVTGIGQNAAQFITRHGDGGEEVLNLEKSDRSSAISTLTNWMREKADHHSIIGIGHRIVQGGPNHTQPELITDELVEDFRRYINFDPEHLLIALELIQVMREQLPELPQVACYDSNFFHDLPKVAQLLPVPHKYQAEGLRRYGFHGLSYEYLLGEFRRVAGETAANGRVLFAHLGTGASLAALHNGKPVDTTMSFTPASGLMMSTRSGDLDPGIARYMQVVYGLGIEEYNNIVNFQSGLLGMSELSADMEVLLQNEANNEAVAQTIQLFVYQVKKAIGSLSVTLGGIDSIVFSGGIGENAVPIRSRICEGLGFLGVEIDEVKNQEHAECISSPTSRVGVHVIKTYEAQVIIDQVLQTLQAADSQAD